MQPPTRRPNPLPPKVRTLLFAPAVRPDFVAKLPTRGADIVIIDLEDATPPNAKDEGRAHTRALAPDLIAAGCSVAVRINAHSTQWFADDVRKGLVAGLVAVIVPKIESLDDLDVIAAALDSAGLEQLGVIAGIETALGVADARPLLAHDRVVGAYFGAEDFVVDMGGVRTTSNDEVAFARASVALAGRLASVPVFDQVVTDFRDEARLVSETAQARAMGYAGKLCIHPAQVAPVNATFTPSAEDVDRARRLLAAYQSAVDSGIAAIAFEGQMVDEPVAVNARRVLAVAEVSKRPDVEG